MLAFLLFLIFIHIVNGQQMNSSSATYNDTVPIVIVVILLVVCASGLGWLYYRNRRVEYRIKNPKKHRGVWFHRIEWFVKHALAEILNLIFTIVGMISLVTSNYGALDIQATKIAFFVFASLKYVIIILSMLMEHKFPDWQDKVAYRFRVPYDWPEILQILSFLPVVIIDGMLINADYSFGRVGDLFPYDTVTIIILDTVLWVKLTGESIVRIHTDQKNGYHHIAAIAYAFLSLGYTICMIFFFIVIHASTVKTTGMKMTPEMIIVLLNALTHAYISSYSSMIAQSIISLDKALKGTKVRIKQLIVYIKYFQVEPIAVIFNIVFYGWTYFIYINTITLSTKAISGSRNEPALRNAIIVEIFFFFFLNAFYLLNLFYGTLKRIGTFTTFMKAPFNCSTYAKAINQVLETCNANFRLDDKMKIR